MTKSLSRKWAPAAHFGDSDRVGLAILELRTRIDTIGWVDLCRAHDREGSMAGIAAQGR
jgi:hypothetical protein